MCSSLRRVPGQADIPSISVHNAIYRTAAQRNPNPAVVIQMISFQEAVCFPDYSTLEIQFGEDVCILTDCTSKTHANSVHISDHSLTEPNTGRGVNHAM